MERKNKNFVKVIALCLPLLLGACGTKKVVEGNGSTSTSQSQNANSSRGHQSEALKKLTFVQKVSDNQVYSKNIVGNMSFSLQMGSKDISVPGALRMRKDQVIRIQLFYSYFRYRGWQTGIHSRLCADYRPFAQGIYQGRLQSGGFPEETGS